MYAHFPCLHYTETKRSRQAKSSGDETTAIELARTAKKAKPSVAARPSAAEKGVRGSSSGVSSDHGNPFRTYTEKGRAEHSGQAERSGEGGLRVSPTTPQHSTSARICQKTQRPGRALRRRGVRVSPPTTSAPPRSYVHRFQLAEGRSPRGLTLHCINNVVYFVFTAVQLPSYLSLAAKASRLNAQMPHRRSGTPFGCQQTREMDYRSVSSSSEG
jgi:hypothetical protein